MTTDSRAGWRTDPFTIVGFGMLPVAGLAALGVWWVVDLFLVKGMVRAANRRRFA